MQLAVGNELSEMTAEPEVQVAKGQAGSFSWDIKAGVAVDVHSMLKKLSC